MTDFAALATNLLRNLGTTVTIRRFAGGEINPVTGEKSHQLQEDFIVNGAWQRSNAVIFGEGGARIENGKKVLVIDATEPPLITDKIRVADENWSIESIDLRKHKDNSVVYFLTVTK